MVELKHRTCTKKRRYKFVSTTFFVLTVLLPQSSIAAKENPFEAPIESFLQRHCYECHGDGAAEGDFQIDELSRDFREPAVAVAWRDALDLVRLGEMPPSEQPRPNAKELRQFTAAIDRRLRSASQAATADGPRLRRLSHTAMDHAAGDLLGTRQKLSQGLPKDPIVSGFDNLSATMVHSKEFVTLLQRNAREIAKTVIVDLEDPRIQKTYSISDIRSGTGTVRSNDGIALVSSSFRDKTAWPKRFEAPFSGRYRVHITCFQRNSLHDLDQHRVEYELERSTSQKRHDRMVRLLKSRLPVNRRRRASLIAAVSAQEAETGRTITGRHLGSFDVGPEMGTTSVEVDLQKGESFYVVASDCERKQYPPFAKILSDPDALKEESFSGKPMVMDGRILLGEQMHLNEISVEGPLVDHWPPAPTQQLFPAGVHGSVDPSAMREMLEKAFREPVSDDTFQLYWRIYEQAAQQRQSNLEGARQWIEAVLCSPRFLYVRSPRDENDGFAIASRLSFFLWNSIPDDQLQRLAEQGRLKDKDVVIEQVRRMVDDPRNERFIVDFAGQWLGLRRVGAMPPDPKLYPDYEGVLEESMRRESELFVQHIIQENRPIRELIAPGYAILNDRLAEHYGIEGVIGKDFRLVDMTRNHPRGGLLGHASMLTITSNGTSTSPVVRGIWILENLLDSPPPPPPPDVPAIEPDVRGATSIRELLAKHRDIATCNQCHRRIDPWGFGLENFDAIGQWRSRYGRGNTSAPVDSTGRLPSGDTFAGIQGIQTALLQREQQLTHAFTAKLLNHATGQPTSVATKLAIDDIVDHNHGEGNLARHLIERICTSPAFLQ